MYFLHCWIRDNKPKPVYSLMIKGFYSIFLITHLSYYLFVTPVWGYKTSPLKVQNWQPIWNYFDYICFIFNFGCWISTSLVKFGSDFMRGKVADDRTVIWGALFFNIVNNLSVYYGFPELHAYDGSSTNKIVSSFFSLAITYFSGFFQFIISELKICIY